MREHANTLKLGLLLTAIMATAACGGGGGGGSSPTAAPPPDQNPPPAEDPPPATGGIERGGVAVGPIDGFGSVIVNGVRFDTSDTQFTIDDNVGAQEDLSVGQVVIVRGSIDDDGLSGTADSIEYDDAVEGPVDAGSIDLAAGTFSVLGQRVRVTTTTVFDDSIQPQSLDGLTDGDVVEVSGLPDADGFIRATRIDTSGTGEFEVKGLVSNLNVGALTFDIGDLTVDYSAATLEDFVQGGPSEGDLVEAKGSGLNGAGALVAAIVELETELEDSDLGEDGDDAEIEGYVTGFRSGSDFDVLGVRVTTTAATVYERGTADQVQLNVRLEVEGHLQADGSILAEKVQFEPEGRLEASATVEAVDVDAGTLTVLGIPILVESGTGFDDELLDQQVFGLADLRVGDWVEVRGFADDQDRFVAQQVERDEPEDEVELRGTAESVNAPGFSILGVSITTNANTEYEDESDNPIPAQTFFDTASGRLVEVDGTWDGAVLTADQASLED